MSVRSPQSTTQPTQCSLDSHPTVVLEYCSIVAGKQPDLLVGRQESRALDRRNFVLVRKARRIREILGCSQRTNQFSYFEPPKSNTYRPIQQLSNRHTIAQQPQNLPWENRTSNVPEKTCSVRLSALRLELRRLRREETVFDSRKRTAGVWDNPFQRSEIDDRLGQSEIHERARRLEVEFDQAFGVKCWVCADQTAVGGVEAGTSWVDEDGRWVGGGV